MSSLLARVRWMSWGERVRVFGAPALLGLVLLAIAPLAGGLRPLVVGALATLPAGAWAWRSAAEVHARLHHRLADTALAAILGFTAGYGLDVTAGAPLVIGAVAVGALAASLAERWRLRARPAAGEALDEVAAAAGVAFEGVVPADAPRVRVPGIELEVAAWIARQGRRSWTSAPELELHDDARRVRVALADARAAGARTGRGLARIVAAALPGARKERGLALWWLLPGARVFVAGRAIREPDPRALALREPVLRLAFTGRVVLGTGRRRDAAQLATAHALGWAALAVAVAVAAAAA